MPTPNRGVCVCVCVCVCVHSVALCNPMDCSLPGSSVYGILQAKNTGVGCHFLLQGIFLTQGFISHLLHLLDWQVDSLPHHFANKGLSRQSYAFSSSHVWMWELDYKESWAPKNWCFWTVVLEKTLESPLDYVEIKPVNPKGNQPWIFIGRTDAEAEAAILWHLVQRASSLE